MVTTEEEAEEILRELWFGWFEGIYNQDEDRIKEVVASQALLEAGTAAFGAPFESKPSPAGIKFEALEILWSDAECLVIWQHIDVTAFRGQGSETDTLLVMRSIANKWLMTTTWVSRDDLWEADCDAQLEPLS